jgi:metal-responsive CopG/Arc/MetJ family transcriptional regulator
LASKKTAISIDEELFRKADLLARELGVSRSQLYSSAIESLLREKEDIELISEINKAYSTPDTPTESKKRALTKDYMKKLAEGEW